LVNLPKNAHAFSCFCSASGQLCTITNQGEALLRLNITRESPFGNGWKHIQNPANCCGLKQIGLGKSSIWALDNPGNVYFRAGITETCPEGTKWVTITATMLNITVSKENQLWAINANDNSLYARCGIDEENMSGISWKRVNLKFRKAHRFNELGFDDEVSRVESDDKSSCAASIIEETCDANSTVEIGTASQAQNVEETVFYYEGSIYDDSSSNAPSASDDFQYPEWFSNKQKVSKLEDKQMSIDVNKYKNITDLSSLVHEAEENNEGLDSYIKQLQISSQRAECAVELATKTRAATDALIQSQKSLKTVRSESALSKLDSFTSVTNTVGSTKEESNNSLNSVDSNVSDELCCLDLNCCSANSSDLTPLSVLPSWFEDSLVGAKRKLSNSEKNKEWKLASLDQLVKRNIREHKNIDKISVSYENDVIYLRILYF
jgi:hypothetical protein